MDSRLEADELLVLARHDLQKGQIEDGLLKLKRLQLLPSPSAEASLELARLYAQLGLRRRALPLFEAYLGHAPQDIDVRFQLGMALFEEGHRAAALPVWKEVLTVAPNYPPALFYRALVVSLP